MCCNGFARPLCTNFQTELQTTDYTVSLEGRGGWSAVYHQQTGDSNQLVVLMPTTRAELAREIGRYMHLQLRVEGKKVKGA